MVSAFEVLRAHLVEELAELLDLRLLLVVRDEAAYVWDSIVELGAAHGLRPVGAATVRPPGMIEASGAGGGVS